MTKFKHKVNDIKAILFENHFINCRIKLDPETMKGIALFEIEKDAINSKKKLKAKPVS